VDPIELLAGEVPEQASAIRQCFRRDAGFRSICEDYRDARQVLARLETSQPRDAMEITQYRELVADLLNEILNDLRKP
jgi:hypothetical protein